MIKNYLTYIKEDNSLTNDVIIVDSKTGEVFTIDKFTFFDHKAHITFNAEFNCLMFDHDNFYKIFPNAKKEDYEPDEKPSTGRFSYSKKYKDVSPYMDILRFGKCGVHYDILDRVEVKISINNRKDRKGTVVNYDPNTYLYLICFDDKVNSKHIGSEFNVPFGHGDKIGASNLKRIINF